MQIVRLAAAVAALAMVGLPVAGLSADLKIEKAYLAYQGCPGDVSVSVENLDFALGRFRLLIAVNEAATAPVRVDPGATLAACGYEQFGYRLITDTAGNYDLGPFTRLIEITGTLAAPGGDYPCAGAGATVELARLHLLATNDRDWECLAVPVVFFWRDCLDNALVSRQGDTMEAVGALFSLQGEDISTFYAFPGFGPPDPSCEGPAGVTLVRGLNGHWGGVDFVCSDRAWDCNDFSGDLNLNGFRLEASDLVLYADYFQFGLGVFRVSVEGQIAASDIDCDGSTLSVHDLYAMMRRIAGDWYPATWKAARSKTAEATLTAVRDAAGVTFTLTAPSGIGAGWLRFDADEAAAIAVTGAPAALGRFDGRASVLLADLDGLRLAVPPGETVTIRVEDPAAEAALAELVGPSGETVAVKEASPLPQTFALAQNYPNPFNPTTCIEFVLPQAVDWQLDVLNVLGQRVAMFAGHADGRVAVTWDAGQCASGVYLYRLRAGDFAATRRMVLLR